MFRAAYEHFIYESSIEGSGKANSYIRALDMMGPILTRHYPEQIIHGTMWREFSVEELDRIYRWLCEEQRKSKTTNTELLKAFTSKSYLQKGYCSAAVRSYREFLVVKGLTK